MKNKSIIVALFFVLFSFLLGGCKKQTTFYLDDILYNYNSEYLELEKEDYNRLINENKSFALFIYQPLCVASSDFNKLLEEFSQDEGISFYKMSFSNMKDTDLINNVKYYPSLIIFKDGKMVDFLDANSDEDTDIYKNINKFENWFFKYVSRKKNNIDIKTTTSHVSDVFDITNINLEGVVYNKKKVNIYFFWGDGCPHCENEHKFFDSIEKEYGNYYVLNTFEVWHNKNNAEILKVFAKAMSDDVSGVPYTIIGDETFIGFTEEYKTAMIKAIKKQYKNSYDVYFDKILKKD